MIDWNGNGQIDMQDWIITGILLDVEDEEDEEDEEDKKEDDKKGPEKPDGSCLVSLLLIMSIPLVAFVLIR